MKLILIVAVARYFVTLAGRDLTWNDIFKAFALVGVPMLMVLKQPDLGTALTYSPILLCGLFLGGIRWKQAVILGLAGAIFIGAAWYSGKVLKPYQKARLTSFVNPDNDPRGSGYQIRQSLIAVVRVGFGARERRKGRKHRGISFPSRIPTLSSRRFAKSMGSWARRLSCCYTSAY